MIDLRTSIEAIVDYAQRYDHLRPPMSPQLRDRMRFDHHPYDPPVPPAVKPDWLASRTCTLTDEQALDRAKGCLLGLAIGDAVGTTLEFLPRDRGHVNDMVGGGPFKLNPGEWTDDTSMALCLADTYLANNDFDFSDYADRLCRWYKHGENSHNGRCFDIGNATREALESHLAKGLDWYGNDHPSTAGNGSIIGDISQTFVVGDLAAKRRAKPLHTPGN